MPHQVRIVETKVLSDGAIAALYRCCDDPSTDSWHTLYVQPGQTDGDIDAHFQDCRTAVEAKHDARQRAEQWMMNKIIA